MAHRISARSVFHDEFQIDWGTSPVLHSAHSLASATQVIPSVEIDHLFAQEPPAVSNAVPAACPLLMQQTTRQIPRQARQAAKSAHSLRDYAAVLRVTLVSASGSG